MSSHINSRKPEMDPLQPHGGWGDNQLRYMGTLDADTCVVFAAMDTHSSRAFIAINERFTKPKRNCVGIAVLSRGAAPTYLGNT